jgi:hypothetical protein
MLSKLFERNLGGLDRLLRLYLGLAMLAYALPYWAPQNGWNWIGLLGIVPLLTAVSGRCSLYGLVGLSSCPR